MFMLVFIAKICFWFAFLDLLTGWLIYPYIRISWFMFVVFAFYDFDMPPIRNCLWPTPFMLYTPITYAFVQPSILLSLEIFLSLDCPLSFNWAQNGTVLYMMFHSMLAAISPNKARNFDWLTPQKIKQKETRDSQYIPFYSNIRNQFYRWTLRG